MRQLAIGLLVLAPLVAVTTPGDASAQRIDSHYQLETSDTEKLSHTADGRVQSRLVDHFTAGGEFRGSTLFLHEYDGRRTSKVVRTHRAADGSINSKMVSTWAYLVDGRNNTRIRQWQDGAGDLTRSERAVWDYSDASGNTLITTVVRGPARVLIETRYTILSNQGRLRSSDTSVFNARDVQTSRHLVEYNDLRTERWTFDERDEVSRHETELRTRDSYGRTTRIEVDIFDGSKNYLGARDTKYSYVARKRQAKRVVTTWFDENDVSTQRQSRTNLYSGTVRTSSRILWERWAQPTSAR